MQCWVWNLSLQERSLEDISRTSTLWLYTFKRPKQSSAVAQTRSKVWWTRCPKCEEVGEWKVIFVVCLLKAKKKRNSKDNKTTQLRTFRQNGVVLGAGSNQVVD
jgi:hypothetical protein